MLSRNREYQSFENPETVFPVASNIAEQEESLLIAQGTPTKFVGHYEDCMEMYAPAHAVEEYLCTHSAWFSRCAEPMKTNPLGENGYELVIGRFGSFGYEVEPKIGLELLPPDAGVYRIRTIPIPDYQAPGYDVDYNASLQLLEISADNAPPGVNHITRVEWELDLAVYIHFPKFINRLPKSLIQTTGDRLLNQIVRQVSRRLTRKVQEEFHSSLGVPFPNKKK